MKHVFYGAELTEALLTGLVVLKKIAPEAVTGSINVNYSFQDGIACAEIERVGDAVPASKLS